MSQTTNCISVLLTIVFCCCGCTAGTGGSATTIGLNKTQNGSQTSASGAGELKYKVPAGWITEQPTSSMRVAQYKLPKVEGDRSEEHTSELQSQSNLVCRLLLEKKK